MEVQLVVAIILQIVVGINVTKLLGLMQTLIVKRELKLEMIS